MIIDAHAHWLPEKIIENAHFFHKGWSDIDAHIAMMRAAGIERAVLSYPTSDAHLKLGSISEVARTYNDTIARVFHRHRDLFIGAAVLPVDNAAGMVHEFDRATDELGFQALSMASSYNGLYLDDPLFYPVYEKASAKRLPIFVHSQIVNPIGYERVKDPLLTPVIEYVFDITMCVGRMLMAGVFTRYPGLVFVFANFGGAVPFLRHRFDATYRMLREMDFVKDLGADPSQQLKNIYVDTGGDVVKTNFLIALDLLGPQHILWGSDWPAKKDATGAMRAVVDLGLSDQDKSDILGGNLARLLGLQG